MNKKGQLGTMLMHLYAVAALLIVIIFFVILFNVAKGSVASASLEVGDLYAEQMLATVMKYHYTFEGKSMSLQQALNRQSTREEALKTIASAIYDDIKKGDKIGYMSIYNEDDEIWSDITLSAQYAIQGYSTACWPYNDQNEIKFVKVYIGDQANLQFFREGLTC